MPLNREVATCAHVRSVMDIILSLKCLH